MRGFISMKKGEKSLNMKHDGRLDCTNSDPASHGRQRNFYSNVCTLFDRQADRQTCYALFVATKPKRASTAFICFLLPFSLPFSISSCSKKYLQLSAERIVYPIFFSWEIIIFRRRLHARDKSELRSFCREKKFRFTPCECHS